MKKCLIAIVSLLMTTSSFAQKDTLVTVNQDTIKIGGFLIVKTRDNHDKKDWLTKNEKSDWGNTQIKIEKIAKPQTDRTTAWWIFDLGFANYYDATNYKTNAEFTHPAVGAPMTAKSFKLNNGKSSNVNIWVVQQKMNLSKHQWNLKYGVGFSMYNFRFEQPISYRNTGASFVYLDSKTFKKDKLFVDYLTVPIQLNYQPNPEKKKSFYASAGFSVGYLIGSHNKQIAEHKEKYNGNFNLNDWQVAGIGEVGMGSLRLYASANVTNLYDNKFTKLYAYPFALGLRFSHF